MPLAVELPYGEQVRDFRLPVAEKGAIRRMAFGGFQKCLYPVQKFQSYDGELMFARILEDTDGVRWVKPAPKQFQIFYNRDVPYEPDFVLETETAKLLCEPKVASDMTDAVVLAKAKAAREWGERATEYELGHGGKPWKYVLIPDDAITANASLAGLVAAYGVRRVGRRLFARWLGGLRGLWQRSAQNESAALRRTPKALRASGLRRVGFCRRLWPDRAMDAYKSVGWPAGFRVIGPGVLSCRYSRFGRDLRGPGYGLWRRGVASCGGRGAGFSFALTGLFFGRALGPWLTPFAIAFRPLGARFLWGGPLVAWLAPFAIAFRPLGLGFFGEGPWFRGLRHSLLSFALTGLGFCGEGPWFHGLRHSIFVFRHSAAMGRWGLGDGSGFLGTRFCSRFGGGSAPRRMKAPLRAALPKRFARPVCEGLVL